jgi:putative tryptophan/tyrosine transport system substrate-binding protein
MRRREFITLLAGSAAWPVAASAQQAAIIPVIGYLGAGTRASYLFAAAVAFSQGLKQLGYIEGHNVTIEFRYAAGRYDRLPALAAELARWPANVVVAAGGAVSVRAAKSATASIPIVFSMGDDPVKLGLVAGLNRPGGNLTGAYQLSSQLEAKRLEVLNELVPSASVIVVLVNPDFPDNEVQLRDVQAAGRVLGKEILVLKASDENGIDKAFWTLAEQRVSALLVAADTFFLTRREQLAVLAGHHAIPAIYSYREYAEAGGLISYGNSLSETYRVVGEYTGRILKGEKPGDLPVQQAKKVKLVINLKTAKALGINLPITVLGRADEVIE